MELTFKEMCKQFNWSSVARNQKDQIQYAHTHGYIIKPTNKKKDGNHTIYEIGDERDYTFKELLEKFGFNTNNACLPANKRIDFFQRRGIKIEESEFSTANKRYYYIREANEDDEWRVYPKDNYFEVSRNGYIRNAKTKVLLGSVNSRWGYYTVSNQTITPSRDYRVNRMVLETFNPIEDSENYIADHINGIRTDNRLENLRWITQRRNSELRDEHYVRLNILYQQLVEKYGYEELENIFKELLRRPVK